MDKGTDNGLRRFDRQKTNYPLLIVTALLCVVLVAGVVLAARSGDLTQLAVAIAGCAIFAVLALIDNAYRRRTAALDDRKFIRWDAAMPEVQRQNVNLEVRELGRLLGVGSDNLADLLSAYIVAEDLALRQVQQEENLPLMRHVSIGGTPFDGVMVDGEMLTCIEVSFLVVPDVRQEKIESMIKKITLAKQKLLEQRSRLRLRLMLVLVTQLTAEEEERLRGVLVTRRFSDTPVDVDIRLLDFEMLQNVYVSE